MSGPRSASGAGRHRAAGARAGERLQREHPRGAGHEVRATLEEAVVAGSPVGAALDREQQALLTQVLRTVAERPGR